MGLNGTPDLSPTQGFVPLTDPSLASFEYVYYLPANASVNQRNMYTNCCGERIVYRVKFDEGGEINTRVINKIFQNYKVYVY